MKFINDILCTEKWKSVGNNYFMDYRRSLPTLIIIDVMVCHNFVYLPTLLMVYNYINILICLIGTHLKL